MCQGRLIGYPIRSILTRSAGSRDRALRMSGESDRGVHDQARDGIAEFTRRGRGLMRASRRCDMAGPMGWSRPGGIIVSGIASASRFCRGCGCGRILITPWTVKKSIPPRDGSIALMRAGMARRRRTRLRMATAEVAVA